MMIDWYREAEIAEANWKGRDNYRPICTAEEASKTLMWKYLYNAPLNATDTNEAKKYLASREIPSDRKLHGSVTGRWSKSEPSWQFPFEFHCSDEMYDKHLKDVDFSKLERRALAMMGDESYGEVQEIVIEHGPTKRVWPSEWHTGASYTPEIKEGTYAVGTSSEALHMDYAKHTKWPGGGIVVIKDEEGNTFTVVPPEDATHLVFDKYGKRHWGNIVVIDEAHYHTGDWFEADCVHDDCDGYYDVDGDSCYCNATPYPPCSVCESGDLVCITCGDYPPEDTKETTSDVDGMWDALQDICRG